MLVITLLSAAVVAPSPWASGLCTLNPYRDYIAPYQWLANQPSRGVVMPIPYATFYSTGSWLGSSCEGWHNDIGYVSGIWSHQPLLYPGGPPSSVLRYITPFFGQYIGGLMLTNGTNSLGKIVGPLGVGYIVSDGYPPTEQGLSGNLERAVFPRSPFYEQEFVAHQTDIQRVYSIGNSTVYINPSWKPIVYPSSDPYVVIGESNTLTYLASANIDLSSHPLMFADQNPAELLDPSGLRLLFADNSLADLAFLYTPPVVSINPGTADLSGFAIVNNPLSIAPFNLGGFERTDSTFVHTTNIGTITARFSVPTTCSCGIFLHGIFSGEGTVSATLDGSSSNSTALIDNVHAAPHWIQLVSGFITSGKHDLVVDVSSSQSTGNYVAIDGISVYEQTALQDSISRWLFQSLPLLNETDFWFGTSSLIRQFSNQDVIASPDWYQSAGGVSVQTLWGSTGTLDLQGARPGMYDVFARTASGFTDANLTISTSPMDNVTLSTARSGVVNDNSLLSNVWINVNPGYETLSNVTSDGASYLNIDAQSDRPAYTLVQKNYAQPQNWSVGNYVSLALKGTNQGNIAMIYFYFGNSRATYAEYDAPISSSWSLFDFAKASPTRLAGVVNWTDVTGLAVATARKTQSESLTLGPYIASHDDRGSPPLQWSYLGSLPLTAPLTAQSAAILQITGSMWLDQVTFLQHGSYRSPTLNETVTLPEINWTQEGPNSFTVSVNSQRNFNLMFEQAYDPRWVAIVGAQFTAPVLTDRYMMSFPLGPGQYIVHIQFNGDTSQWIGYGLSVSGVLVVATLIGLPYLKRFRKNPRSSIELPKG